MFPRAIAAGKPGPGVTACTSPGLLKRVESNLNYKPGDERCSAFEVPALVATSPLLSTTNGHMSDLNPEVSTISTKSSTSWPCSRLSSYLVKTTDF